MPPRGGRGPAVGRSERLGGSLGALPIQGGDFSRPPRSFSLRNTRVPFSLIFPPFPLFPSLDPSRPDAPAAEPDRSPVVLPLSDLEEDLASPSPDPPPGAVPAPAEDLPLDASLLPTDSKTPKKRDTIALCIALDEAIARIVYWKDLFAFREAVRAYARDTVVDSRALGRVKFLELVCTHLGPLLSRFVPVLRTKRTLTFEPLALHLFLFHFLGSERLLLYRGQGPSDVGAQKTSKLLDKIGHSMPKLPGFALLTHEGSEECDTAWIYTYIPSTAGERGWFTRPVLKRLTALAYEVTGHPAPLDPAPLEELEETEETEPEETEPEETRCLTRELAAMPWGVLLEAIQRGIKDNTIEWPWAQDLPDLPAEPEPVPMEPEMGSPVRVPPPTAKRKGGGRKGRQAQVKEGQPLEQPEYSPPQKQTRGAATRRSRRFAAESPPQEEEEEGIIIIIEEEEEELVVEPVVPVTDASTEMEGSPPRRTTSRHEIDGDTASIERHHDTILSSVHALGSYFKAGCPAQDPAMDRAPGCIYPFITGCGQPSAPLCSLGPSKLLGGEEDGLFASCDIEEGTRITEYAGVLLSDKKAGLGGTHELMLTRGKWYLCGKVLTLLDRKVLVGLGIGLASFANSSKGMKEKDKDGKLKPLQPNCKISDGVGFNAYCKHLLGKEDAKPVTVPRAEEEVLAPIHYLVANRSIKKGEELVWAYPVQRTTEVDRRTVEAFQERMMEAGIPMRHREWDQGMLNPNGPNEPLPLDPVRQRLQFEDDVEERDEVEGRTPTPHAPPASYHEPSDSEDYEQGEDELEGLSSLERIGKTYGGASSEDEDQDLDLHGDDDKFVLHQDLDSADPDAHVLVDLDGRPKMEYVDPDDATTLNEGLLRYMTEPLPEPTSMSSRAPCLSPPASPPSPAHPEPPAGPPEYSYDESGGGGYDLGAANEDPVAIQTPEQQQLLERREELEKLERSWTEEERWEYCQMFQNVGYHGASYSFDPWINITPTMKRKNPALLEANLRHVDGLCMRVEISKFGDGHGRIDIDLSQAPTLHGKPQMRTDVSRLLIGPLQVPNDSKHQLHLKASRKKNEPHLNPPPDVLERTAGTKRAREDSGSRRVEKRPIKDRPARRVPCPFLQQKLFFQKNRHRRPLNPEP